MKLEDRNIFSVIGNLKPVKIDDLCIELLDISHFNICLIQFLS